MPFRPQQTGAKPRVLEYDEIGYHFEEIGKMLAGLPYGPLTDTATKRLSAYLNYLTIHTPGGSLYGGRMPHEIDDTVAEGGARRLRDEPDREKRMAAHRNLMRRTDEHVSTASIDHLSQGYFATSGALSKSGREKFNTIYRALTVARLPTFVTASHITQGNRTEVFAHPVGGSKAANQPGRHSIVLQQNDASAPDHDRFDKERATQVIQAAYQAAGKKGPTLESVLVEMLHTASSYTLHHSEPPFATNVVFTHGATTQDQLNQLREHFKTATNLLHHDPQVAGMPTRPRNSAAGLPSEAWKTESEPDPVEPTTATWMKTLSPSQARALK